MTLDDRRLGTLLGLACGDALGTTLEFSRPGALPWAPPLAGPHADITGGGPFAVRPGQVTDDTQMACCLAASLRAYGGHDAADCARRYVAWSRHAFDIGGQTRASLQAFSRLGDAGTCGLRVWREGGGQAAGNGALMRVAPIAALINDAAARRAAAIDDALITHADPRCLLANAAFCAALACGQDGGDGPAMLAAARAELPVAAALAAGRVGGEGAGFTQALAVAQADLGQDLDLAGAEDPLLYGPLHLAERGMGFVRIAFRLAFWQLLHAPGWREGLVDTVNRGGDSDTNGAITGALLGARWGAEAIPAAWRERVLGCRPPAPWDADWHPRVLIGGTGQAG